MLKALFGKLFAAKFATGLAFAAVATAGSVGVAAATGALPIGTPTSTATTSASTSSDSPPSDETSTSVSVTSPSITGSTSVAAPTVTSSSSSSAPAPTSSGPHPSLQGLCTAYQAGVAASHGKALQNPAFSVLITTAGGQDNVLTYCATLTKPTTDDSGEAEPTESDSPEGHEGAPPTHPNQDNIPHPTGEPTAHPGKP